MDCNPVAAKTCVLKMQLKCETCQKKVKKVMQKIHGVHSISIDANDGTAAVSSTVDPHLLIAMLAKAGKKAELLWELPQQTPVNIPNPQVEQPFKNVQMASPPPRPPPSPGPPPPPPPASNLQASGFDYAQLQELAKIPGLKHVELQHSRNVKLVFKDHYDDDHLSHGDEHAMKISLDRQLYNGAANVGHGHVRNQEQHMQMKPMVYHRPSPVHYYYARPFATPTNYSGYGGLQPRNLPHADFNCSDDGKCIVM
ncbi:hypothetical protein ACOSP7_001558 [Xanthoceras sorbifolium]